MVVVCRDSTGPTCAHTPVGRPLTKPSILLHKVHVRAPHVTFAAAPQAESHAAGDAGTNRLVRTPESFVESPGRLTNVNKMSSTSPNDVFRCAGCVEPACQGPFGCAGFPWRLEQGGYLREILTSKVYDVAVETPMEHAKGLSSKFDNEILLKREDLQPVKSFKLRGAYNKMAQLSREQLDNGVICSSAGNHAQGVALAASKLGCKAIICMPTNTPEIKVAAVKALGGTVELVGESYQETQAFAQEKSQSEGMVFIAPYDDPYTIAGQGTIGAEILRQCDFDNLEAVLVPVGGGGLIAGVAAYIKSVRPSIKIIGVEPMGANAMAQSLAIGERVTLSRVDTFADGVAVKQVGAETFRICKDLVDGVVLVSNAATSAAIKDVFNESRSILEPSGAIAVAGCKEYIRNYGITGKTVVAITSGANMNFDRLRQVTDLAGVGDAEATLAVQLPEEDGSFAKFLGLAMDGQTFDVTELKYRYSAGCDGSLLFGVGLSPNSDEFTALYARLQNAGYQVVNLSDLEIAQVHLRHLVGGHSNASSALDTITESTSEELYEIERIFLVDFPERPGALQSFLPRISPEFGITLFHYRRTGNRSSGVLLGIRVAGRSLSALDTALDEINGENEFSIKEISDEERRIFRFFLR
jgi:threonine dehydratase